MKHETDLDKLLEGMTEEQITELANENKRRYLKLYHAKKALERSLEKAGEPDATV